MPGVWVVVKVEEIPAVPTGVQGAAPVAEVSHWKVWPEPKEAPVNPSVKFSPAQIEAAVVVAVPGVGGAVHGVEGIIAILKFGRLLLREAVVGAEPLT